MTNGLTGVARWRRACTGPLLAVLLTLLAGCTTVKEQGAHHAGARPAEPERQVADYLATPCPTLWRLKGAVAENNPLYWLRGIDCAERLAPADARSLAHRFDEETWQAAFRQGILLAKAKITPQERRHNLNKLDNMSYAVPRQVHTLYQMLRDNQAQELSLSDARWRYSTLQEQSDSELDELRQQQKHLHSQLEQTRRKLQNLTDIERQLSSRKGASSYLPDGDAPDPQAPQSDDAQEAKP
ncbi:two-component system QseEF-associated lipoprotein QseG [Jejubacter calystegiae]|uniref:Two-component system QseEF-associated lipoprotein QseG n=1 Tax=Jejubacter calystegiae TaxID=2579935 RepID=A0A4V1G8A0_9ENTR|nr:two-component system QseEF-associated lipoprotein QseG [Jejubacter calystegiae]QCT22417.1 two-component system QseEF-associated lipoprotein QseG [Jejubacter calystegiae]